MTTPGLTKSNTSNAPSADSTACPPSAASSGVGDEGLGEAANDGANVWLHVYHTDPWTAFLNNWVLKSREIPIYHLGVEVYGEEWSFQYFEDAWDDQSISGVIRCQPKRMTDYDYQESVCLGPTKLNEDQVDEILLRLHYEYPASSYHLTRRNCITFAGVLVELLGAPKPFPATLKGICDASNNSSSIDATVDYSWSWAKWYMLRKHQSPDPDPGGRALGGCLCCNAPGADRQGSMWNILLQPGYTCTGKMCPGGPRREEGTMEDPMGHLRDGSRTPSDKRPAEPH